MFQSGDPVAHRYAENYVPDTLVFKCNFKSVLKSYIMSNVYKQ